MPEIELPRTVYVRDEAGEPIRLCVTDSERPDLGAISIQEAMALIEDLMRAVRVRLK